MPTLEATLDRLQRVYGSDTKFPIWSTEFGYLTNPPNPQYTVTPALAAYYLNWAEYMTLAGSADQSPSTNSSSPTRRAPRSSRLGS